MSYEPMESVEFEKSRWDKMVDFYLDRIDKTMARAETFRKKSEEISLSHELVEPNSRLLVKLTIGALLLVFTVILCSCAATSIASAPTPLPTPRSREPMRAPSKGGEQLFIKRESVLIKKRESGSHTGSLWADSRPPRSLYSEDRPSRTGEVIVVSIPEELRYQAPAPTAAASKDGKAAPGDKELTMTNPDSAGVLGASTAEPLTEMRMEIVAIEPTGDVYLRGTREYTTNQGIARKVALMAKVPRRSLSGYAIDAKLLTGVTVHEDYEGNMSDYAASGWDKVVSRKLAGFVPDLNAELATLEDVRKELGANQQALREQQKNIRTERERLLKERKRVQEALDRAEAAAAKAEAEKPSTDSADASDATVASAGNAKKVAAKTAPTPTPTPKVGGTRP